jgi:phosphoglucomutase
LNHPVDPLRFTMISSSLDDLAQTWLLWDRDPQTIAQIRSLNQAMSQSGPDSMKAKSELESRLRNRIQFGTAGLRARMKAGFAFLNCLTIIQASQGVAQYLFSSASFAQTPLSVVIGNDSRHNSARFARLAFNAFREKGFKVHLFQDYVPTPVVAFAVKTLNATAGIMITASHNPAQDNGYKVYQSNGAQISSPVDENMAKSIGQNLEPWNNAWDQSEIASEPESPTLLSTIREQYIGKLLSQPRLVSQYQFVT